MFRYSTDFTGSTGLGMTGWTLSSATGAGQAGGSLYLKDNVSVRTSYLSGVATNNGAVKVTLVAKLNKTTMGMVRMKYGLLAAEDSEVYTGEWITLEYVVTPTSQYSNYVQISPFLVADGMFLKSIKIEQSPEFLGAPVGGLPNDCDGSSFTAYWKPITGATKYFIDVYSYNAAKEKVMLVNNREVLPDAESTTIVRHKVEGLAAGVKYFYVVRAANATGISKSSAEVEVVKIVNSLAAPVVTVDCDKDGNYKATWSPVKDAESYFVKVISRRTLKAPAETNILFEDFNCFTTGSFSKYEYAYDRHLALLNDEGWTGAEMAYIKGACGLAPYSNEAFLATPALNLADDNGKVTVELSAAAIKSNTLTTGAWLKYALIDANGNIGATDSVQLDYAGFKKYTLTLNGGTAASKVKLFSSDQNYRYFFDEITVKQVKPAGYVSVNNVASADTEESSYSGSVALGADIEYYISVTAEGRTVKSGAITAVYSDPSTEVLIGSQSGIADVDIDSDNSVSVKATGNGQIDVTVATETVVSVYNLAGSCIATINAQPGTNSVSLSTRSIVIVKAGNKAFKVIL